LIKERRYILGFLNDLSEEIYNNAKEKGWHDKSVAFGDAISNIHGELSEAWEEYRNGKQLNETYYSLDKHGFQKPEGVPSEFADTIIRVLDNCKMYNIDIDAAIREKIEYNKLRSYKHDGKII
jgi:NTP pyrophosphatase (non-canonical NTP hydrolase)